MTSEARNGDNLDCLGVLIEAWRDEGDDLWKDSLVAKYVDEAKMMALRDRCAILFHCANQLERLVQPNSTLGRSRPPNAGGEAEGGR